MFVCVCVCACVCACMCENNVSHRALAHSMLEKVDRYLWSPRPPTLGPHLHSTLTMEMDKADCPTNTKVRTVEPLIKDPPK